MATAATARPRSGTDPAYFNTQLQLLNNPLLLRRVIVKLDLEHDPAFLRHMEKGGRILRRVLRLGYLGASTDAAVTAAAELPGDLAEAQRMRPFVNELQRRLTIRPVMETRTAFRETRLADVVVEHPHPQLAAAIANAIAEGFVAENREKNSRSGATTNAYLRRRVQDLQAEIRQADEQLIAYGASKQILSLEPGQNVAIDRLTSLNRQLLEAENERKLAEANYREGLRPDAAGSLATDMAKNVINDTEIRLAELRAKRAQLLVGATESWPEVKEVTQQIRALEANVESVSQRAASAAVAKSRDPLQPDARPRAILARGFRAAARTDPGAEPGRGRLSPAPAGRPDEAGPPRRGAEAARGERSGAG